MTTQTVQPRYHRFAIAAVFCAATPFLWVTPPLSLLFGVLSRREIRRSPDVYRGMWMANVGLAVGGLFFVMLVSLVVLKTVAFVACGSGTFTGCR